MAVKSDGMPEEIKEPIERILAKRARKIYLEETGKQWEKEPPSDEEAKEYVRRAAKMLLEEWQKMGREYYSAVKKILGAPPEREKVAYFRVDHVAEVKGGKLVKRDKTRFEIIPLEPKGPPEIPPRAVLKCPICQEYTMKRIADGIWQCTRNPTHFVSIRKWFPTYRRVRKGTS